jgi:hypothetical protein
MNHSILFRHIFGPQLSNEKMMELLQFVKTNNGKIIFLVVIIFLQGNILFLHHIDGHIDYKGKCSFCFVFISFLIYRFFNIGVNHQIIT